MSPIVAFIKLIRLPNLLIIVLTQYSIRYGIIAPILLSVSDDVEISLQMTHLDFFLLSLSTVMIAAAGYIINDYFDVKVDSVNRPDKIIVGKYLKRRIAMGSHVVINSIAILIAGYLAYKMGNWNLIFIQLLAAGALWYYSTMFKKQVLVGNVVVALLAGMVPFVAGLYELILQHNHIDDIVNNLLFYLEAETAFDDVKYILSIVYRNIMFWVLGFSLFAFISTMVREIIKDNEDYEGDKKYYSNTLAVVYGKKKAKLVAQLIIVMMISMVAYFQYMQMIDNPGGENPEEAKAQTRALITVMYLLFSVQIPLLYVLIKLKTASTQIDFHKLSGNMKLVMLMGIGYTALFYYLTIKL